MTNFKEAFSAVALATTVGLTGCAGTHFAAPSNPEDSTAVNRSQDRGVKEYGSQACRDAEAKVIPGHMRVLRGEFSHVTSVNGSPHTIIFPSDLSNRRNHLANRPITVGGTVVGGLLGGAATRDRSPSTQAAAGVGGAVAGYIAGQMGDNYMKAGNAEARERCSADVIDGAYDRPQNLGPGYRQQNYKPQVIQGYRPIGEPAPGTVPAVECPQGFTCIPQRR